LNDNRTKLLRNRVAQEAALLLYTSQEKEYKQAKKRAAETFGARILPSNSEVAEELDRIADEREGTKKRELLKRMRKEAKQLMTLLRAFNPLLVGSVWRGTARRNSDIDIHVFPQDANMVLDLLKKNNYNTEHSEWRSVTKNGNKQSSIHINLVLESGDAAEIVVRSPDCIGQTERCETYGDQKTGLNLSQLTKVLEENPLQKFVPN
jgi:predicted nucleotidyltransferase